MADEREVVSVRIALDFVVVAVAVFILVPFEVAAPIFPLFLFLLVALYRYRS